MMIADWNNGDQRNEEDVQITHGVGAIDVTQESEDGLWERVTSVRSPEGRKARGPMGRAFQDGGSHCKGPEAVNTLVRNGIVCTHCHTAIWPTWGTAACILILPPGQRGTPRPK